MSEDRIRLISHKLEDIQNYLAKDMVYRENHEKEIKINALNNEKLNDKLNKIAITITSQPNERIRELNKVTDEIYTSIRETSKHHDSSLRLHELNFNEFKEDLYQEHKKIKNEVIETIESRFLSNVRTAKWISGALFVVIVALISSLSAISLSVLGSIQTDIKDLQHVVIYGSENKRDNEDKK